MSKSFILIDSKYRRPGVGSSTDFIYDLSEPITVQNRVFLKYASIPLTTYLINTYNRTFKIGSTTISLTQGNYTQDALKDELQARINAAFPGVYTVSFNANQYKFTISQASTFTLDLSLSNLNTVLGFAKSIYTSANTYTSINSVNFLGDSNLKVVIQEFGRSSFISNQNLTATYIVPITSSIGDTQTFQELLQFTQFCAVNNRKFDYLTVRILDDQNQIYNNNNVDIQLLLFYE